MDSIIEALATLRGVPPWGWACGILGALFLGLLVGGLKSPKSRAARRANRPEGDLSALRDLKATMARLEAENTALSSFFLLLPDFTKEINSRLERRAIAPLLAKITERLFAPTQVLLFLLDERVDTLILVQQRGLAEDVKTGFQVKMGEGRIGWVAQHKVPMDTNDFIREMRQSGASLEVPAHFRFKTELCAPMVHEGRVSGVISVGGITKHYNDTQGHQAGDEVLKLAGQILRDMVRPDDTPARYGGEEFIVILPQTPKDGAMVAAERIRAKVAEHPYSNRESQPLKVVSLSGGVATFPDDGRNGTDLIAAADAALYRAKQAGRNRVMRAETKYFSDGTEDAYYNVNNG